MEVLMEAGLDFEDLNTDEDGYVNLTAAPSDFEAIKNALTAAKEDLDFDQCEVDMVPSTRVDLDEDHLEKFKRFISILEEYDDFENIYHNANLPEEDEEEE
jgi:transcriptional/translational regulatory protein YebC/TACO1